MIPPFLGSSYPSSLIALEKWLADQRGRWSLIPNPLAARAQHWLAARRLNRGVPGLLTSIWWQVQTAGYEVVVDRQEGETDEQHELRRLRVSDGFRTGALGTIGAFVYNDLKQRGLLHLIPPPPAPEPPAEQGWTCPTCGGPGEQMVGGRWGCADGHPAVWDDGHGVQVQILPTPGGRS